MNDLATEAEIERNYRRLISRIILVAIRDLAWVRAGEKVRKIPPANYVFGKGTLSYPRRYIYNACGTGNPKEELEIFFKSELFETWAGLLEETLGFEMNGKTLLRKRKLPEFIGNMMND